MAYLYHLTSTLITKTNHKPCHLIHPSNVLTITPTRMGGARGGGGGLYFKYVHYFPPTISSWGFNVSPLYIEP